MLSLPYLVLLVPRVQRAAVQSCVVGPPNAWRFVKSCNTRGAHSG